MRALLYETQFLRKISPCTKSNVFLSFGPFQEIRFTELLEIGLCQISFHSDIFSSSKIGKGHWGLNLENIVDKSATLVQFIKFRNCDYNGVHNAAVIYFTPDSECFCTYPQLSIVFNFSSEKGKFFYIITEWLFYISAQT